MTESSFKKKCLCKEKLDKVSLGLESLSMFT